MRTFPRTLVVLIALVVVGAACQAGATPTPSPTGQPTGEPTATPLAEVASRTRPADARLLELARVMAL